MDNQLILDVLGLSGPDWPTDQYALLGLPRGTHDPDQIEVAVLERMERLRHYQVTHPEPVTAAMNRLAQAMVCLTDPVLRRDHDRVLGLAVLEESIESFVAEEAPIKELELVPIELTPTVQRSSADFDGVADDWDETPRIYPIAAAPVQRPPRRGIDPSRLTRPGATSHRANPKRREWYRRLVDERRLLNAWDTLGEFLADPHRKARRRVQVVEWISALLVIRDAADAGVWTGPAGERTVALARSPLVSRTLRGLDPAAREELASDWRAGWRALTEKYTQDRRAVRARRPRLFKVRWRPGIRTLFDDYLEFVLLFFGLLVLAAAVWRSM